MKYHGVAGYHQNIASSAERTMKPLTLIANTEIGLKTKMYLVKAAVYGLLGYLPKTRDLKKLAIKKGWVAKGYSDFRRKATWLDVYNALAMKGRMLGLAAAA